MLAHWLFKTAPNDTAKQMSKHPSLGVSHPQPLTEETWDQSCEAFRDLFLQKKINFSRL